VRLPATLEFHRSRALTVAVVLAHAVVAAGLLATNLPTIGKLLVLPLLVWSLLATVRRAPAGALTLGGDGRLTLVRPEGHTVDCMVDPLTTVLPWLIVLRLHTPSGRQTLTLPVDALGDEGHRQLRVWLRWKAMAETA
jgi:Membrane-bound toxin component of toxin-antitoxin system